MDRELTLDSEVPIKLHTVGTSNTNRKHYSCVSGQNHFAISTLGKNNHWNGCLTTNIENAEFPTLRVPSDICSDDYGHIYVSGQYSHNIHRSTREHGSTSGLRVTLSYLYYSI
jgi:hypothetical protein